MRDEVTLTLVEKNVISQRQGDNIRVLPVGSWERIGRAREIMRSVGEDYNWMAKKYTA